MLGCGAHVRIIALPHVRCACRSACGKGFELCVRKYVRAAIFLTCDLRSHFYNCTTCISLFLNVSICKMAIIVNRDIEKSDMHGVHNKLRAVLFTSNTVEYLLNRTSVRNEAFSSR